MGNLVDICNHETKKVNNEIEIDKEAIQIESNIMNGKSGLTRDLNHENNGTINNKNRNK